MSDPKSRSSRPSHSSLSRRTWLRGAGVAVALPYLESLLPRAARAAQLGPPQRLVLFHVPCGINLATYRPMQTGASYALSQSLAPLAPVQSDILILSNMQNSAALATADRLHGRHSTGLVGLYSGTVFPPDEVQSSPSVTDVTVDQIYAKRMAGATPVPSLQLGVTSGFDCDDISPCVDISTISWSDPKTPLPPQMNAQKAFDTFFVGPDAQQSALETARRKNMRQSVLDAVSGQATSLAPKLGQADGQKLDQYLTSVRELETQLAAGGPGASCAGARPAAFTTPTDYRNELGVWMNLMVLALQCDLTRSISFLYGPGHCGHIYDFLPGITDAHHSYSHHDGDPVKLAALTTIVTWEMSIFSGFLQSLKKIPEGSGTLLDNTAVVLGSEVQDPNPHNYIDVPVIIGGRGGGFISTGRHVAAGTPGARADTGAMWLGLLQGLNVPVTSFGQLKVTTPLAALTG
jgi:hypothetical protein